MRDRASHTGQTGKGGFSEDLRLEVSFAEYVVLGQIEGRETTNGLVVKIGFESVLVRVLQRNITKSIYRYI